MGNTAHDGEKRVGTAEEVKDFVEQLRLVHFALVFTCLTLVVISLSPPPTMYQRASDQLREITEVVALWNDPRFLGDASDLLGKAEKDSINSSQTGWRVKPKDEIACPKSPQLEGTSYFKIDHHQQIAAEFVYMVPFFRKHGFSGLSYEDAKTTLPSPTTLEEFRNIWDSQLELVCAKQLTSETVLALNPTRWVDRDYVLTANVANAETVYFSFAENIDLGLPGYLKENEFSFYGGAGRSGTLVFPVEEVISVPIDVRAQARLMSADAAKWGHASFQNVFWELNQATTTVQRLKLDDLRDVVNLQLAKNKESFEAFGIKFPAEQTLYWGTLVILGIQLYFWMHLSEFQRRRLPQTNVAWVGAYPSLISRIVFLATAAFVPVGAIIMLLFFQHAPPFHRFWSYLALSSSVMLAGMTWHTHKRSSLGK